MALAAGWKAGDRHVRPGLWYAVDDIEREKGHRFENLFVGQSLRFPKAGVQNTGDPFWRWNGFGWQAHELRDSTVITLCCVDFGTPDHGPPSEWRLPKTTRLA